MGDRCLLFWAEKNLYDFGVFLKPDAGAIALFFILVTKFFEQYFASLMVTRFLTSSLLLTQAIMSVFLHRMRIIDVNAF